MQPRRVVHVTRQFPSVQLKWPPGGQRSRHAGAGSHFEGAGASIWKACSPFCVRRSEAQWTSRKCDVDSRGSVRCATVGRIMDLRTEPLTIRTQRCFQAGTDPHFDALATHDLLTVFRRRRRQVSADGVGRSHTVSSRGVLDLNNSDSIIGRG